MLPIVTTIALNNQGRFVVVRKGGLEPPRYCYRQPLKLVEIAC